MFWIAEYLRNIQIFIVQMLIWYQDISSPGKVTITDEIVGITKEAWKLKNKGVDILIAVGHAGYLKDLEIAQKVGIIDVVVGGHTNTFLWDGTQLQLDRSLDHSQFFSRWLLVIQVPNRQ